MIAAWMLRALALSLLLYVAARLAERGVQALRWPLRWVWAAAILLTIGLSFAASFRHAGGYEKVVVTTTRVDGTAIPVHATTRYRGHPVAGTSWLVPTVALPAAISGLDQPLVILWGAGSLAWALVLVASALWLRRSRRRWTRARLDGAPIYLSRDTGPALVGLFRCGIVVPNWVLALAPAERAMIVAHEREHERARDPLLLLCGALAVLALPWNPLVWAMFQRLRFTIEADCDRRVLAARHDLRRYGELLVLVGERMLTRPLPLVALSEPHSDLGRRISIMTERVRTGARWRVGALGVVAALIAIAGCEMPMPIVAPRERVVIDHPGRDVVTLTTLDFSGTGRAPWLDIYSHGGARMSLDGGAFITIRDTVQVRGLRDASFDVTEGDVHLDLPGPGTTRISATSNAPGTMSFSAEGPHIVLLRGGNGISSGPRDMAEPRPQN